MERQFRKLVTRFNKGTLVTFFEPQQIVFSEAGAAKLVHSVRMVMEANPSFVLVKCDIKNAFNTISRARILEVLEGEESLRHMAWHAALSLAPFGNLESRGKVWGQASDGTTQGDPEAGAYFAVGWHPLLRQLDSVVAAASGVARAGCVTWWWVDHMRWSFQLLSSSGETLSRPAVSNLREARQRCTPAQGFYLLEHLRA